MGELGCFRSVIDSRFCFPSPVITDCAVVEYIASHSAKGVTANTYHTHITTTTTVPIAGRHMSLPNTNTLPADSARAW